MKVKKQCLIFIRNRGDILLSILPVLPKWQINNSYLLNINEDSFNQSLIVGCFLLGLLTINILLMSNNSRSNNISSTHNVENEHHNPRCDLTSKLLAQLIHNNGNTGQPLTYLSFPSNHPGYLNLEARIRFVSIIRSSSLADRYRFGSSLGTLYIRGTHDHPHVSSDMIGVVLNAELSTS